MQIYTNLRMNIKFLCYTLGIKKKNQLYGINLNFFYFEYDNLEIID